MCLSLSLSHWLGGGRGIGKLFLRLLETRRNCMKDFYRSEPCYRCAHICLSVPDSATNILYILIDTNKAGPPIGGF